MSATKIRIKRMFLKYMDLAILRLDTLNETDFKNKNENTISNKIYLS